MVDLDMIYYRERLAQERERALQAPNKAASAAHRALAELYRQRLEDDPPRAQSEIN
jgi:SOS response regulatory protein OraA/RecX